MARRYETKTINVTEDGLRTLEVTVNHKRQGILIFDEPMGTYTFEGDPFKKVYTNQDEAVIDLCKKNGRKLELDKNKKKKK